MTRPSIVLASLLALLVACGETGGSVSTERSTTTAPDSTTTTTAPATPPTTGPAETASLADRTRPVGSALLEPVGDGTESRPVGLSIPSLDIDAASIVEVGVEPTGEMEIPGARSVGWYRFGAVPGEAGSAVLAAHIAFDGIDGVFRHLDTLDVGDSFAVAYQDGSTRRFVVTETATYAKDEIPFDRLFSSTGAPEVALVTCGGEFNASLRTYSDNVVAFAVPVGP